MHGPWKFKRSSLGATGSIKSTSPSLAQKPVGLLPVHATAASGLTESVSPSPTAMRAVLERVAITTHSRSNIVVAKDQRTLIGTGLNTSAEVLASTGATSTFEDTADMGAAQGM